VRSEAIVIIGAGPAGCAAAVQCVRLGVMPRLIDRNGRPGGLLLNAWSVENYPGIEPTDGRAMAVHLKEFLDRFDITIEQEIVDGIHVESVHGEGEHYLVETTGENTLVRAVIVATGTRPKLLVVPGADDLREKKLWYEVIDLFELEPDPGHIVVIGGGEAALDYSLSLAGAGGRVTLLVRGVTYRACRRLIEAVEASQTITPLFGVEVESLESTEGGVSVRFSRAAVETTLACNGVVAALGREAATSDLLKECPVEKQSSIYTDYQGLFIVGDARLGVLGQAGIAVGDGLEAAMAAVSVMERGRV